MDMEKDKSGLGSEKCKHGTILPLALIRRELRIGKRRELGFDLGALSRI